MDHIRKQAGISFYGWLVVLLVVIFFALLTVKLTPVYLEHHSVKSSLEALKEVPFLSKKTEYDIRNIFEKHLQVNDIRSVKKEDLKISKADNGKILLEIQYAPQVHIVANVDAVVKFNDKLEIAPQ